MEKRFLNDTNILIYFLKDEIPLPDAVIAATCIVRGMILVTRNEKDFRNISELQVLNPFSEITAGQISHSPS